MQELGQRHEQQQYLSCLQFVLGGILPTYLCHNTKFDELYLCLCRLTQLCANAEGHTEHCIGHLLYNGAEFLATNSDLPNL